MGDYSWILHESLLDICVINIICNTDDTFKYSDCQWDNVKVHIPDLKQTLLPFSLEHIQKYD